MRWCSDVLQNKYRIIVAPLKMTASSHANILARILRRKFVRLNTIRTFSKSRSVTCTSTSGGKTHFGFQNVPVKEKERKVHDVFENVAAKYDLMNDVMSVGVHRLWKDYFVRKLAPMPGTHLIDVAGGTGDIAFRFLKYIQTLPNHPSSSPYDIKLPSEMESHVYMNQHVNMGSSSDSEANNSSSQSRSELECSSHVTVVDINQPMLDVGKDKANKEGLTGVSWVCGNAESLPSDDNSYDAYTISFGIRNTTHPDKVLSEAYRVLKPGGRFMCLEFSHVPNPLLRRMYDSYALRVIPIMGQIIARDWYSYRYLVESIRRFPNQDNFADMIRTAGFRCVTYENLTFGVVAIHSGFKF